MQSNGSDYGILKSQKNLSFRVFGRWVHFGVVYDNWFDRYKRIDSRLDVRFAVLLCDVSGIEV
jgi:hypothetical protein